MTENNDSMKVDAELKELIEASKKNNRLAQEKLYRKFAKPFFHIALSYCADREAAKEVLQESFIKIFKNLGQYKFEGAFEGWMRRIIVNTSIDYHKKNSKMAYYSDINDQKVADKLEYFDPGESKINTDAILNEVKKLPEGARMVFNLFAIDGYSHKEIAKKMDISESTSKSQYARAKSLLSNWLKKEYHG